MTYKLTTHDYDIKYKNTVAGIKTDKGIVPFKIKCSGQIDSNKYTLIGTTYNEESENWESHNVGVDHPSLHLEYPTLGAINTEGGFVIFCERVRTKQWRETLNPETINTYDPFYTERELLGISDLSEGIFNLSFLKALFNNKLFSFEEAVSSIESGKRLAAAFHPEWYLGILHKPNRICLFNKKYPVAHLRKDGKLILTKDVSFLKEEVSEFGREVVVL